MAHSTMARDTEASLRAEFDQYAAEQGFVGCADAEELLLRRDLTSPQRRWLTDFVWRWDAMVKHQTGAPLTTSHEILRYLDTLPLERALWWFIENATDDSPWRTDVYCRLRDRLRS